MLFKNRKLLKAAKKGNLELFKKCLTEGVDDEAFKKALDIATSAGHVPVADEILKAPQSSLLSNEDKTECLRRVCVFGGLREISIISMAKFLLSHGADINYCDGCGDTILSDVGVKVSRQKVVKFLIDRGANTAIKNNDGRMAWERASRGSKALFPEYRELRLKENRIVEDAKKVKLGLEQGATSWTAEKKDYVSCTEYLKNTNRSICEIFNFRTKQIVTVNCNLKTDAESSFETDFSKYMDRDRLAQACDFANENDQNVDKDMILGLEVKMTNGHLVHKMKIKVAK